MFLINAIVLIFAFGIIGYKIFKQKNKEDDSTIALSNREILFIVIGFLLFLAVVVLVSYLLDLGNWKEVFNNWGIIAMLLLLVVELSYSVILNSRKENSKSKGIE